MTGAPVQLSDRRKLVERLRAEREITIRMRALARHARDSAPPIPAGEPPRQFVDMLMAFLKTAIETGLWTPDMGGSSVEDFCRQAAMEATWEAAPPMSIPTVRQAMRALPEDDR